MKSPLVEKDPDAGEYWGQEEKGTTEDEMVGLHHQLNGRESEKTLGDSEGQGSLSCCTPWGRKSQTWLSDWTSEGTVWSKTAVLSIFWLCHSVSCYLLTAIGFYTTSVLYCLCRRLEATNHISKIPMSIKTLVGDCKIGRERNLCVFWWCFLQLQHLWVWFEDSWPLQRIGASIGNHGVFNSQVNGTVLLWQEPCLQLVAGKCKVKGSSRRMRAALWYVFTLSLCSSILALSFFALPTLPKTC